MLAIGAALTLLLGSGLMALVSDSMVSDVNSVQSGTFTPPAHDLVVAKVSTDANCADATFDTGSQIDARITDLDFALNPGATSIGSHDLCLKNAGEQTGRVVVSFTNVYEYEIGPGYGTPSCEASEADPNRGGDTTCLSSSDVGELRPIVRFGLAASLSTSPSCTSFELPFGEVQEGGAVLDTDLEPGEICRVQMQAISAPETEQQQYAAQTDALQWDVVFTLEDAGITVGADINPNAN
jgi:hypothetical protein